MIDESSLAVGMNALHESFDLERDPTQAARK